MLRPYVPHGTKWIGEGAGEAFTLVVLEEQNSKMIFLCGIKFIFMPANIFYCFGSSNMVAMKTLFKIAFRKKQFSTVL